MQYLQPALDLAEARGYLRYPEVMALSKRVPDWFRALGTDDGVMHFETHRGFRLPGAMRELYACLPLACFLEATTDGEVFLRDLATIIHGDLPPVAYWSTGPHLVFSFHNHSGAVFAAQLGRDDPLTFCGFHDEPEPIEMDRPPCALSAWVFSAVDNYEAELDVWQRVYEECKANPSEAARQGSVEWIRSMPGMAQRLK